MENTIKEPIIMLVREDGNLNNLRYEKINNSNTAILIDLHNTYSVMALSGYDMENEIYNTTLLLKENRSDFLLNIDVKPFEINATSRTITLEVLNLRATLRSEGFFNKYIGEYEYYLRSFDLGNTQIESETLNA